MGSAEVAFFESFRVELRKYAAGVHELGPPAPADAVEGALVSGQLADFYRSWDGARLFAETVSIYPLGDLRPTSAGMIIGEWPEGVLELGQDGRVRSRDEAGAAIVVGSTLERFLAAIMAREGLLVDREGEFKEVFDEEGVTERVRERQTRLALKLDPEAAAWQFEAAERAFSAGEEVAALAGLRRVVELDEEAAEAWALLGALQRRAGHASEAAASYARAAAVTPVGANRAEWSAEAARAAKDAGDSQGRDRHAAVARAADPTAVGRWLDEARALLEATDSEGALRRATLAAAVDEEAAAPLVQQARLRTRLRTL